MWSYRINAPSDMGPNMLQRAPPHHTEQCHEGQNFRFRISVSTLDAMKHFTHALLSQKANNATWCTQQSKHCTETIFLPHSVVWKCTNFS